MKKIFEYKRIYLLVLLPISFILIFAARQSQFFAEKIYALHIYKWVSVDDIRADPVFSS
ncbi:MAG: hypothetical protein K0R92_2781 [Lachnospiraceae bacterium]|nr:hypothetical protein [Lachnospiraceae bacterium]